MTILGACGITGLPARKREPERAYCELCDAKHPLRSMRYVGQDEASGVKLYRCKRCDSYRPGVCLDGASD